MNRAWEHQELGIIRAIRRAGATVALPARGRWEIRPSDGRAFGVLGVLDGDWLLLESPPARAADVPPPAELLRSNAGLSGLAKFAESARGEPAGVRAEIPIGEGIDLAGRLNETLRGFSTAHAILSGEPARAAVEIHAKKDCRDLGDGPGGPEAPDSRRAVAGTLRKTRWPFRERDDGSITVDLESDRGYHQAKLAMLPGGAFAASAEIADWRGASPPSREAAARMLLSANHGLRMARAVASEEVGRWTGRFEVCLGSPPSETEMRHLLAAISVACRHWARELRSLQTESTARSYLAVRAVRS